MSTKRNKSIGGVKALFSTPENEEKVTPKAEEILESKEPKESSKPSPAPSKKKASKTESQSSSPKQNESVGRKEEKENLTETSIRFFLSTRERDRVEAFIQNEYSTVNTLSDICRRALADYLDREEPLLEEIEKTVSKLRNR